MVWSLFAFPASVTLYLTMETKGKTMSTISGVSSTSSAWSNMSAIRSQMQAKMFAKADTDSSGGVDKTELQSLLDDVTKKTGVTTTSSIDELLKKMDADSNGSLSEDELSQGLKDILRPPPPPFAMDSAQSSSDSTESDDDLFGKVDTDGNGSLSQDELQSLMDKMASDSGSSTSTTSISISDMFAKLDTDSDGSLSQTEFEVGRPQGGNEPPGAGGMPPPPPPGGAGGSSSVSSTTYDPLDTNEDGVVSTEELAAASTSADPLQALFEAIDSDGDNSISASESDAFIQQLTSQVAAVAQPANSTGTSSSADSQSKQDGFYWAQLARQAYEQIASGLAQQARGSTLSAVA